MSHATTLLRSRPRFFDHFISYAFYPLLLTMTLGLYFCALQEGWNLAEVFVWMASGRMLLLLAVEFLHPAKPEWKMSWGSFRRDLKYMAINGGIASLLKGGLTWLALDWSRWNTGIVSNTSIAIEFLAILLSFSSIGITDSAMKAPAALAHGFGKCIWRITYRTRCIY